MNKNITKIQIATLILIIAYFIWEISVWQWSQTLTAPGPIIRVDLILIYPMLLVLIVLSIIQLIKKKKIIK